MAINIEWQTLPSQTNNATDSPRLYPRMINNETVDIISFCEEVARHGTFTKGAVKGLLYDMMDVIAKLLHEGKTIDLEDLGTFKLSIGAAADVTPNTPYNKRQVAIRGINFQPHKTLIDSIGSPKFHTVPRNAEVMVMSQEKTQETLLEYFKTHDHITRSQFEKLCRLKRATANFRLKQFVKSGFLRKVGNNRGTKYVVETTKNNTFL